MINKEYVKSFNPCKDRYAHYLEHYKDWSGSLEEFLDLENITHKDKAWVFVRSVDKKTAVAFAADCDERAIHTYEAIRKAIEAARSDNADIACAVAARAAAYAAAYAVAIDAIDAAVDKQLEQAIQLELMKKYAKIGVRG